MGLLYLYLYHSVTSITNWLLKDTNIQSVKKFPHSMELGTSIRTFRVPYGLFVSVPYSQMLAVGLYHQLYEYSRDHFLFVFMFHCQVPKYWLIFDISHDTTQTGDLLIPADKWLYMWLAHTVTLKPECMISSNNNNNNNNNHNHNKINITRRGSATRA